MQLWVDPIDKPRPCVNNALGRLGIGSTHYLMWVPVDSLDPV